MILPASMFENGGNFELGPYEGSIVTIEAVVVTNTAATDGKGWLEVGAGIA